MQNFEKGDAISAVTNTAGEGAQSSDPTSTSEITSNAAGKGTSPDSPMPPPPSPKRQSFKIRIGNKVAEERRQRDQPVSDAPADVNHDELDDFDVVDWWLQDRDL